MPSVDSGASTAATPPASCNPPWAARAAKPTYAYDRLGRVLSGIKAGQAEHFAFDPAGNSAAASHRSPHGVLMVSYLVVNSICNVEAYPRIGGSCALPDNIAWPRDDKDRPCTFLLGVESSWISENAGVNLPDDLLLSVFVPFDPLSVDHAVAMARVPMSAKALLHPKATVFRQESSFPLDPPRALQVDLEPDTEDEDEFSSEIESKIGGIPTWLQRRIEIPQRRFVLQLMSHQIRERWPAHSSIFMGGVGYLFLDIAWNGANPEVGELRLQYT